MTGSAVGQGLDVILLYKLGAQFGLVVRIYVINIEHFGSWPDIFGRIAMAVHAPIHIQSVYAVHQWHFVDFAVASGTTDAFIDMNAVIEVHEIGQIVNSRPGD
jgi:hypothetical protein